MGSLALVGDPLWSTKRTIKGTSSRSQSSVLDAKAKWLDLGIAASGLFWTAFPFPAANVEINLGQGTAALHATNWALKDFTSLANSLGLLSPPIPAVPAAVSFAVNWTATGKPTQLPNKTTSTTGFAGLFINSSAQIAWSANEPAANFQFVSNPAATSTAISGVIGKERNGKFYPPGV
jgi:hypothetical protein